jgi:signal peptidase II
MNSEIKSVVVGPASLKWLWLSGIVLALDQYTKWLVVSNLYEFQRIFMLPIFDLVRYHNKGAAFSLFADGDGWQTWFFSVVAALISVAILWYQWSLPRQGCRTLATGLALILGGAVGNVIDRMVYGHVVDFLLFYYEEWAWPAFNVADSAICVGVALVIIDSLFFERQRKQSA